VWRSASASTIYRVVQEALTNAAKHAGAERVSVTVERDNGTVEVLIEDDGHGFDTAAPTGGLGLLGMRERVELTGGSLSISSRPGTRVSARLPA
jgi:signal transduction histidine kinase